MFMLMDDSLLPTWRSLENPSAETDPCGERQKPKMKGRGSSSPEKRSEFCPTWSEPVADIRPAAELAPVLGTYGCQTLRSTIAVSPIGWRGPRGDAAFIPPPMQALLCCL